MYTELKVNALVKYDKADSYAVANMWRVAYVAETSIGKRYTLDNVSSPGVTVSGVTDSEIERFK